jgi:hypothetical protein
MYGVDFRGGSFCTQNGFYQNYLPWRARRR